MSYETAARVEERLIELGNLLQEQLASKNFEAARYTLRGLRSQANGCKLRLLGIMLKTTRKTAGKAGLELMEEKAAPIIKLVLEREEYTARAGMLARALGKVGTRFLGPLGIALFVKDAIGGGITVTDSMAEKVAYNRMAQYGDYIDGLEASGNVTAIKTYPQWLASDYLPGQQESRSKFFQNFKTLFPHSLPV